MLKNQQIFPQWATRQNEVTTDGGQQNLVEPLGLEKDGSKLVARDKDENGLELSLGLTCGSSQGKSSDAQRKMSDSLEIRNTFKVSNANTERIPNRSFVEDKSYQQELSNFKDADSQAHATNGSEVAKGFLANEHELHMLKNATSFHDFSQSMSYPPSTESWSWGKINGAPEKLRSLITGFPPHLKGAAQMFLSQNNPSDERGGDFVNSSKGGPVAQLSEFLQQHGMAEQQVQRDVHLQKQQEARKKRKMLLDEQKQQKKAKEDDQSLQCTGTSFRRPGSCQWSRSWETQTRETPTLSSIDHSIDPEQLMEASSATQAVDPSGRSYGVRTEEANAGKYGSQEDRIGATMNYIQRLRGEESTSSPSLSCQTATLPGGNQGVHSNTCVKKTEGVSIESAPVETLEEELLPTQSQGKDIANEEAVPRSPKDVLVESSTEGKDQLETSLPSESVNMNSLLGIGQLGTTRGIPAMDVLCKEPYNLQPGHVVGQTFGGSGSSPDLPWVSSPSTNGKAVSGVVYRLMHGPIRIVCTCHGKHMTPTEFSTHGTTLELADKDGPSAVGALSDGIEATSAKA